LRIKGEEMDNKEELGFDAVGFGRDRIIRRIIGELPTFGLPSRRGLFLPELLGLAMLPRGEDLPGGGRPEADGPVPPLPPVLVLVDPMEREGDEALNERGGPSWGLLEVSSCWLGCLGLNFLGGGWGEGLSVQ